MNIIYAMTCPCGHYDYVDSTEQTLAHAMSCKKQIYIYIYTGIKCIVIDHQRHINRVIHEKLTGNAVHLDLPVVDSVAHE